MTMKIRTKLLVKMSPKRYTRRLAISCLATAGESSTELHTYAKREEDKERDGMAAELPAQGAGLRIVHYIRVMKVV